MKHVGFIPERSVLTDPAPSIVAGYQDVMPMDDRAGLYLGHGTTWKTRKFKALPILEPRLKSMKRMSAALSISISTSRTGFFGRWNRSYAYFSAVERG